MEKLTIRDIDVEGKKALVRVDFNVPLDEKAVTITDDSRIRASLPTINYLIEQGAMVILCSHLGRPEAKVVEGMKLGIVARCLTQLMGKQVIATNDCIGPEVEEVVRDMKSGDIILLENLRFHPEEELNDVDFARSLAGLADVYVNDAFGTVHRKHASIVGVTQYLPSVAGFLMEKELEYLVGITVNPLHPFGGLVGGAKVSDKVTMLENIMGKIDCLLVGGGMAATFLKAQAFNIGLSLIEEDRVKTAAALMKKASENGVKLLLPVDVMVASEISSEAETETVSIEKIQSYHRIVDIGRETIEQFSAELKICKTIFWNGTMGIHEIPQFAHGTHAIAGLLADLKATTVIGGGSTSEAVTNLGFSEKMTFLSTGGGASLRLLGGQKLPGVEALLNKE